MLGCHKRRQEKQTNKEDKRDQNSSPHTWDTHRGLLTSLDRLLPLPVGEVQWGQEAMLSRVNGWSSVIRVTALEWDLVESVNKQQCTFVQSNSWQPRDWSCLNALKWDSRARSWVSQEAVRKPEPLCKYNGNIWHLSWRLGGVQEPERDAVVCGLTSNCSWDTWFFWDLN